MGASAGTGGGAAVGAGGGAGNVVIGGSGGAVVGGNAGAGNVVVGGSGGAVIGGNAGAGNVVVGGSGGAVVGGSGGAVVGGSGGAIGGSGGAVIGGSGGAIGGSGGAIGGSGGAIGGSGGAIGGSGGVGGAVECRVAEDCMLVEDCCSCASIPRGAQFGLCKAACGENACARNGIGPSDVACLAGRCGFAPSCDEAEVTCFVAEPACPPGQAPVVKDACYTGGCLPVSECSQVTDCAVCDAAGLRCAAWFSFVSTYRCVEVPPACADSPTCGCMGLCTTPFDCGDPRSERLECYCETC